MDERFILHRLYATRLAAIVGAVMLGAWFAYLFFARQELRYDLFSVLCAMGLAKGVAMLYYRRTN